MSLPYHSHSTVLFLFVLYSLSPPLPLPISFAVTLLSINFTAFGGVKVVPLTYHLYSQVIAMRVFHSLVLGYILHKQGECNWWNAHFEQKHGTKRMAFESWKRLFFWYAAPPSLQVEGCKPCRYSHTHTHTHTHIHTQPMQFEWPLTYKQANTHHLHCFQTFHSHPLSHHTVSINECGSIYNSSLVMTWVTFGVCAVKFWWVDLDLSTVVLQQQFFARLLLGGVGLIYISFCCPLCVLNVTFVSTLEFWGSETRPQKQKNRVLC